MIKPEAIFFDLDDTLLAFSRASVKASKKCYEIFLLENHVTSFNSEELLKTVTEVRKWYWSDDVRNANGRKNMQQARRDVLGLALNKYHFTNQEAINQTADSYSVLQEEMWELFDGVPQSLQKLKNFGIKLAVVTNGKSDIQRRKLRRFDLEKYFDEIIIDTEVGYSKPDIKIYQVALNRLGLKAKNVWMIGDNLKWDVGAPQKVGIYGVWNDFNRTGLPNLTTVSPDCIVDSVQSMVELIL